MVAKPHGSLEQLMAELEALPISVKGEIIEGVLYTHPRPGPPHMDVEGMVVDDIKLAYQRGRGGPGGWWIISEPGIWLSGSPEFSPDVAGWRRERMPSLPQKITLAPDWLCEIHGTEGFRYDTRVKRPFYAKIGVQWLVVRERRRAHDCGEPTRGRPLVRDGRAQRRREGEAPTVRRGGD